MTRSEGDITLSEANQFDPVLELNLPGGFYVSNMTLSVSAVEEGDNYLDCKFIDETQRELSGDFGLSVKQAQQLAHTYVFILEDPTMVVLMCKPLNPAPLWQYSTIHHAEWKVVKVDELDEQTPP